MIGEETDIRDTFGRVVGRRGSFAIDVPVEALAGGGTFVTDEGVVVRIGEAIPGGGVMGESSP